MSFYSDLHITCESVVIHRRDINTLILERDHYFGITKMMKIGNSKPKKAQFWLGTAKKEFFFKNKREVEYVEN